MSSTSDNVFWDSCVLGRWLTDVPPGNKPDLDAMLRDAKLGKRRIYHSTILYAEMRPALLKKGGFESVDDLIADMEGVLLPIGPSPHIMMMAGRLRDHVFFRPDGIRQASEKNRVMSVPDAIQLATCLHLKHDRGVADIEFHTFDDGRGTNYEERAVSLLKLHDYCEHLRGNDDIDRACALPRIHPKLAQGSMF